MGSHAARALALVFLIGAGVGCHQAAPADPGTEDVEPVAAGTAAVASPVTDRLAAITDPALRAAFVAAQQRDADASYQVRAGREAHQYRAVSRAARLVTTFDGHTVSLQAASDARPDIAGAMATDATDAPSDGAETGAVRLRLARLGYAGRLEPAPAAAPPRASENRVEIERGPVREWYVNGPLGLQQGFTLQAPPSAGEGELVLEIAVEGASVELTEGEDAVVLDRGDGRPRMRYGELVVLDADGRVVPARLATVAGAIQLRAADRGARYPLEVDPLVVVSETRLVPRTYGTEQTQMGRSVDVDGDLAVVGAPGFRIGGNFEGAAYVFRRAGSRWSQEAILTPSGSGGNFGITVAIHGQTIAVGSYQEDSLNGAAYVFEKVGLAWVERIRLQAPDPEPMNIPRFGGEVYLTAGELLVSSPNEGAAYLFEGASTSWTYTQKFASTYTAASGGPIAIDGDVAVVGRNVYQRTDGEWSLAQTLAQSAGAEPARVDVDGETIALGMSSLGNVMVYVKQGSQWVLEDTLTPQTPVGPYVASFGSGVEIEGGLIAVAMQAADMPEWDSGGAFVFARTDAQWAQIAALGAPDSQMHAQLGTDIGLSGGTLFVGSWGWDSPEGLQAVGAAYVSEHTGTGFSELRRVTPALDDSDPIAALGSAASIDGDTVILGARRSGLTALRGGGAYAFVRSPGSGWEQQGVLLAEDPLTARQLGSSADLDGDTAILGAPQDPGSSRAEGAAYVFTRSGTVWSQQAKLLPGDPEMDSYFGTDVAVDGDAAVVGTPGQAFATGAAYVFTRSGTVWTESQKLLASDAEIISNFGGAVAIEGGTLLVGAPLADHAPVLPWSGESGGAVYVFTRSGTVWSEQARLEGWQVDDMLGLGSSVAIDGNTIMAAGNDVSPDRFVQPTVFLYEGSGSSWSQLARIQSPSAASACLHGDLVVADQWVYAPTTPARTAWAQQTELVASDTTGAAVTFTDVACQGSTVVLGGGGTNGDRPGAGWVFELADALAPGDGCIDDAQCLSGYCVEGVCCDAPCNGACESCAQYAKADGTADGTCSQVITGLACGPRGGCASATEHELPPTCDAAGQCQPNSLACQGGYACVGDSLTGRCVTSCLVTGVPDQSRCADDHWCDAGVCQPDKGVGGPCAIDEECLSGSCAGSVCQGVIGDPCDVTACAQGTCVDGYCCQELCNDQCEACGEAGFEGSCVAVTGAPRGSRNPCIDHPECGGACNGQARDACAYPGSETGCGTDSCVSGQLTLNQCNGVGACVPDAPVACAPYLGCADAATCATTCSSDGECVADHFCDGAPGACQPDRARGQSCVRDEQCTSGNCADGVCCNTACNQQCEACNETGQEGTCTPVVGMPRGARAACAGGSSACAGSCDGARRDGCVYPVATSCGSSTCSNGVAFGSLCDGQGACATSSSGQSCFPYTACADGTECLSSCLSQAQCATGYFCDSARVPAQCVQQQADGAACDTAAQCLSGFCVDGTCCNTACTGQCEACAESGSEGQCVAVGGAPRGSRLACAGAADASNVCAGSCDGARRDACAFPAQGTACVDAACDGAVLTPARVCDGAGVCGLSSTQDCGAYGCDASANQCNTRCDSRGDCAAGALCRIESRECAFVPSVCIDGFTVELADGSQTSCQGHRCTAGECQERCGDDNDCAPDYLCFDRDCVLEADVMLDAGVDAGTDAGVAGPADAGADASASRDAGGSPAPDAGADAAAPTASGGDAAAPGDDADDTSQSEDSGCGCRVPGGRGRPTPAPLALLILGLLVRRRRRA